MREISSYSCLAFLPGSAWLLLNKICTPFSLSLYNSQQTAEVNAFDYSKQLSGRKICRWACPSQFFSFLPSSEALLEATTTQTFVHCPLQSQLLFLCFNATATAAATAAAAIAHPKEFTLQFVPSPFPVLLLCEASAAEDLSSQSDFYLTKLYFLKSTAINIWISTVIFCHETVQKIMKLNCQNLSGRKNTPNPIHAGLFFCFISI